MRQRSAVSRGHAKSRYPVIFSEDPNQLRIVTEGKKLGRPSNLGCWETPPQTIAHHAHHRNREVGRLLDHEIELRFANRHNLAGRHEWLVRRLAPQYLSKKAGT